MKRLALSIAALAAMPALAQPPVDWTKPVTGVDAPASDDADLINIPVPLAAQPVREMTRDEIDQYVIDQGLFVYVREHGIFTDQPVLPATAGMLLTETPLPPPCEPPVARMPSQPGPPKPPAPCSPLK